MELAIYMNGLDLYTYLNSFITELAHRCLDSGDPTADPTALKQFTCLCVTHF